MAKADGKVLISLDVQDNTKEPIDKMEARFKDIGKGAGDQLDDSMKSNATKAEETAKKASNVIEGKFKKPVTQDVKVDGKQAMSELKTITNETAKTVKGDNDLNVKVTGDASDKVKDIYENKEKVTKGDNDVVINEKGNAGEKLKELSKDEKEIPKERTTKFSISGNAKEKISDTAKAAKSAGNGFSRLHDIIMGTFIGGAIQSGLSVITNGLRNMLSEGLKYGKVQQKMLATWTTLTGTASKGQAMVDVTNKLSVALGQDTDVVDELDQQFYHVFNNKSKTEQLTKSVLTMGDAVGMTGDDVKRLGLNFTHMMASTKLQLGDFNMISDQLPMFGENLLKYEQKAQKNTKLTMSELRKQMSAGKISAKDAENVMNKLGKKYSKASDNLMGTLSGMGRVVKSRVPALVSDMTKPFLNAENPVLGMVSKWVQSKKADQMIKGLGKNIKTAMDTVIAAFNPKFTANSFNKNMQDFINKLGRDIIAFGKSIARHKKDIINFFKILKEGGQITGKITIAYLKALLPVVQMFGDFAAKHPKLFGFLITGFVDLSIASKLLSRPIGMILSLNGALGKLSKKLADVGGLKTITTNIKGMASGLTGKTTSNSKVVNTIGKNAMTEGGAAGKLATGAAGAGVATSAGLDIYSAFKAKNPDKKFKDAGKGIGTAIGGGIGLFFGGPLGAALGATIGKVIGGWGGKGAKQFTDGWNKKGKKGKPPKGLLPKAGYYARSGADAIASWAKSFAKGFGKTIKSIARFNKSVGKTFGKVVGIIKSVLKPIGRVLELAIVIPIALVVGLAIKAWQKIKKPLKAVINYISKAIKSAWKGIKSVTKSTWNAVKKYVINPAKKVWNAVNKYIVKKIVKGIKNAWKGIKSVIRPAWKLIKKYAVDPIVSVYHKASSIMRKLKKVISSSMSSIKRTWHSAWKKVGDFFGDIWKSIKRHAQNGINGVISIINAGINGIDAVIHAFGGKKHAIRRLRKVHFATGTGSLSSGFRKSINQITPAVVNDEPGAKNPELIFRKATGNVEYMKGNNANTLLMPGDEVANAHDSAVLAPQLGISHFASGGIGSFFSGLGSTISDAASGVVSTVKKDASWLKKLFKTAVKIIKHPIKSVESLFKYSKGTTKGAFRQLSKGAFDKVESSVKSWWSKLWSMVNPNKGKSSKTSTKGIKGQVGSGFFSMIKKLANKFGISSSGSYGNPAGDSVSRWKPLVKKALAELNLSTSGSMVAKVLRQISTESGGNPKAMGGTDGLSDGHAEGLMQVKPGTFKAYSKGGSIWNGYDNIVAGLNYAKHRYGKSLSFLGNGHGYANGGIVNGLTATLLGEDPLHPLEHIINTAKPSSDGLLADAISTRAKNNPSGVYAKMNDLVTSAHSSQKLFSTQLQTGSSLQETSSNSKLLKQMASDMHKTAQKNINGDVYLGVNKVGNVLDKRKNKKDLNSLYFSGQLKNQGGLSNA